jgi:hypothetical protein
LVLKSPAPFGKFVDLDRSAFSLAFDAFSRFDKFAD